MEVINVFNHIEFDTSPSTEGSPEQKLSPTHGYFGNPKNFLNQHATDCSALKFHADDEFSVNNGNLHVKY